MTYYQQLLEAAQAHGMDTEALKRDLERYAASFELDYETCAQALFTALDAYRWAWKGETDGKQNDHHC